MCPHPGRKDGEGDGHGGGGGVGVADETLESHHSISVYGDVVMW